MKILITRPEPEATALCQAIEALGHEGVCLPLLEIQFLDWTCPDAWNEIEGVIFVSKNAVRGFGARASLQEKLLFAVGPGTAALLQDQGFSVIYPKHAGGSEALLKLPSLQTLPLKRVAVVKGNAGRVEIEAHLRARGLQVETLCVYQVRRAVLNVAQQRLFKRSYDLVIVTSLDALRYACELGLSPHQVVSILSPNMLKYALAQGLMRFFHLTLGSNEEILSKIKDMV